MNKISASIIKFKTLGQVHHNKFCIDGRIFRFNGRQIYSTYASGGKLFGNFNNPSP